MNLLGQLYSWRMAEFKYSLFIFLLFRSNIQQFTCNSLISSAMSYLHAEDGNIPAAPRQRTADGVGAAAALPLSSRKKEKKERKKKNTTIRPWLS